MRRFLILSAALSATIVIGGLVSSAIELPSDVAYYGQWSLYPRLGYLDHPGGVAWPLIPFERAQLSAALRWLPLLTAAVNGVIMVVLLTQVDATMSTAVAVFLSPLWIAGTLLWTPDLGLLLFWHLSLLLLVRRRALWLLPFTVAAMTCFKIVGLPLALLLLWVYRNDDTRRGWTVVGAIASLLTLLLTGLPSLLFQFQHRAGGMGFRWAGPVETLLGQMAITGPALFFVGLIALRNWWTHRHAILTSGDDFTDGMGRIALAVIAAFLLTSFVLRVEPNWLAPALMPMSLTAAALFRPRPLRTPGTPVWPVLAGAQALVLALVLVLALTSLIPLGKNDPTARLRGWSEWVEELPTADVDLVLSDRYQWHAQLFLHAGLDGATFAAVDGGHSVRRGALDGTVDLEHQRVLLVWTQVAPDEAVRQQWPTVCSEGEVGPPPGREERTHWQVRALSQRCP